MRIDFARIRPAYLKCSKWSGIIEEKGLGCIVIPLEEGVKNPLFGFVKSLNIWIKKSLVNPPASIPGNKKNESYYQDF